MRAELSEWEFQSEDIFTNIKNERILKEKEIYENLRQIKELRDWIQ
jgi:hypothetical protein